MVVDEITNVVTFLRLKQVKVATGMSRSWIYDAIKRGDFPAPIALGLRAVAWSSGSIAAWQADRMAMAPKSLAVRA